MAERAPPDSRIFEARNHRNVPALFYPFWGIRLKRPFDGHRLRARVANSETQVARRRGGGDGSSNEGAADPAAPLRLDGHQRAQQRVLAMHFEADISRR